MNITGSEFQIDRQSHEAFEENQNSTELNKKKHKLRAPKKYDK